MSFRQTKAVTTAMLIAALAAYLVAAYFQHRAANTALPVGLALLATALLALALLARFIWAKCPHCGRRIGRKQMNAENCPWCGKPLG